MYEGYADSTMKLFSVIFSDGLSLCFLAQIDFYGPCHRSLSLPLNFLCPPSTSLHCLIQCNIQCSILLNMALGSYLWLSTYTSCCRLKTGTMVHWRN
ncbi:hypothetical protein EDD17DRAFT_1609984 [Pisolithus thermaeus]|nr:hypothetical protein EDD17DRAFT_1609984 [Pisolithus thermaeus]